MKQLQKRLKQSSFLLMLMLHASWQRGLNENTNGLLRQYFFKKSCFASISKTMLKTIETKLNNRPRKTLNFFSPFQIFSKECKLKEIMC